MKTEGVHTRPRYRNDVVFRSAQRLLASRPKKPRCKLPPRWIVFLVGIACGLGAAFLLLRPSREITAHTANGDATTSAAFGTRKRLNLPLAGARPTFAVPTPAPKTSPTTTEVTDQFPTPAEPTPASSRQPVPTLAPQPASRPHMSTASTPLGTFLNRPTTLIRLQGELRADSLRPMKVEFELHLAPGHFVGAVYGLVRLPDDPQQTAAVRVSGLWLNRTITLREAEITPGRAQYPFEKGRAFVLEFPEAAGSDDISGYWTHGTVRGTLTLRSVSPL